MDKDTIAKYTKEYFNRSVVPSLTTRIVNRGTVGKRDDTLGYIIHVPDKPGHIYVEFEKPINGNTLQEISTGNIVGEFRLIGELRVELTVEGFLICRDPGYATDTDAVQLAAWRQERG